MELHNAGRFAEAIEVSEKGRYRSYEGEAI